jgi:hypothetical protein
VVADDRGDLFWKVHGERTVYDSRWICVALVDVRPPAGSRFEHHVVHLDQVDIALITNQHHQIQTRADIGGL